MTIIDTAAPETNTTTDNPSFSVEPDGEFYCEEVKSLRGWDYGDDRRYVICQDSPRGNRSASFSIEAIERIHGALGVWLRQKREAAKASHPAFQTSDAVEQAYDWWAEEDEFPEPVETPTLPFGVTVIAAGDKVKIRWVKVGNTGHPRFHKYKESLDWLEVKVNRLNQLHAEGFLLDKVEILEHAPALPDWERELLGGADYYTKAEREANGRLVFIQSGDWGVAEEDIHEHRAPYYQCNEAGGCPSFCLLTFDPDEFWPVFEVGDRVVTSDTPFWHRWTGDIAPLVEDLYRGVTGTVVRLEDEAFPGDVEVRLDRGSSLFFARECLTLLPQPVEPEVVEEKPAEAVPSFSVGDKVKIIAEPYWQDRYETPSQKFYRDDDWPYVSAPHIGDLATVTEELDDDGDHLIRIESTGIQWHIAPEVLELAKEDRPLAVGDRVRVGGDYPTDGGRGEEGVILRTPGSRNVWYHVEIPGRAETWLLAESELERV